MRALCVAGLLVAGCGAPEPAVARAAVTNGAPDPGDPAVVALIGPDGDVTCSGALIAPHVVLTAAHCKIGPLTFRDYHVFAGAAVATGGSFADIADARVHPEFDPTTWRNDLALLTIRQSGLAAPLPLDARTLDPALVGATFQTVGFGVTGPGAGDAGDKRSGTAQVAAVGDVDFTATPAPSEPCVGDSGGPALFTVDGATYVTGVTSHGDETCAVQATFARVDVAAASFIQPYLAATAAGAAKVGDPCFYDEHCASGRCLQAADEPSLYFCSQACAGGGDCPGGMTCAPDGCRYSVPSPGATGAACAADADCVSSVCYVATGRARGVCTWRCGGVGQECPAAFPCQNVRGTINFYCLAPPSSSGCGLAPASGGAGPSGGAVALVVVLVGASPRRRRRGPP
jgi:hypothetical protein